jgi:branched-chain amino acid transport system substrate-binding protein
MLSISKRQLCAFSATVCAILAGSRAAVAQTATEIVIGSCAALEGPSSFLGRETVAGAEGYFRYVNEEGGVNGRKLRLVSAHDSYDPSKTQAC